MRILAIDPGTNESAHVVWDGQKICSHSIDKNEDILNLIRLLEYDVLAVELVQHYGTGMPVGQEVFDTCIWTGRYIQTAVNHQRPYELIPRREVKLHLCNSVRAKDANVRQALLDKVGPQGTKKQPGPTYGIKADEWAALGLALTAYHQELNGAF